MRPQYAARYINRAGATQKPYKKTQSRIESSVTNDPWSQSGNLVSWALTLLHLKTANQRWYFTRQLCVLISNGHLLDLAFVLFCRLLLLRARHHNGRVVNSCFGRLQWLYVSLRLADHYHMVFVWIVLLCCHQCFLTWRHAYIIFFTHHGAIC